MNKRNLILVPVFLMAVSLAKPAIYAETAEEYYARSGKAVVVQPGGGFVQTYAPQQSKRKVQDLNSPESQGAFEISEAAKEYYKQGMYYATIGNFTEAVQNFTLALEIEPHYPQAYRNRGLAHSSQSNYTQAIEDFSRALALAPDYALVYYDRAQAYAALKDYPQVINDCTMSIENGRGFGEVYRLRGTAYNLMQEYEKALEDFLKAKGFGQKIDTDLISQLKGLVGKKNRPVQ